jgi:phosphoglycolate phosphatase
MEKRFETVIFDFDGTIADTFRGVRFCFLEALHAFGYDEPDEAKLHTYLGPPLFDSFMLYCHDEETARQMVAKYREVYRAGALLKCDLYDGITDVFAKLSAAGIKLAIASSKPGEFVKRLLGHFDIEKYFDFISAPVIGKPEPTKYDLITAAVSALDADISSTAMVGDRKFDIEGAKQTGAFAVGVSYGFGTLDELESHGADFICHTPEQISELILQ